MTVYFSGYVFQDDGDALNGATVQLLQVSDGAEEASTTTDSNGFWSFNEADEDQYDVKITSGTSVRYRKWADEISLKMIDVRNNEGAGVPAAVFANHTNNADNDIVHYRSLRGTGADNDEMYFRYYMDDASSNTTEVARMTVKLISASAASEDSEIRWGVAVGGSIVDVFTISNTSGGATDMTMDVAGDINLDADGGDVFFKDGGTTFGSATNNSGNLIIKSGTTTALTFSGANLTAAGTIDSGAITSSGSITSGGSFIIGSASIAESELEMIDGITAGTAAASKAVVLDGSKNIATIGTIGSGAITSTGTSSFGSGTTIGNLTLANGSITDSGGALDFGDETLTTTGAADLGATTVDSLTSTGTITGGSDGSGVDVVLYSGTAGDNLTWDASEEQLIITGTNGATSLNVADGNVTIADDLAVDGTSNLDNTDIDGTLVVDGSNISLDSTATLNIDNSNTSNGITIGTATSAVPISIGHTTSETTINDNLTVTGTVDIGGGAIDGTAIGASSTSTIVGTTIDATTDFTIGDTVITDGVITDTSGLALAANVTVTGNVLPNADDTYDLGSASAAWQDLFLEGDITLTDAGTIATSAGALTIDGDDGIILQTSGSGNVAISEDVNITTASGAATAHGGYDDLTIKGGSVVGISIGTNDDNGYTSIQFGDTSSNTIGTIGYAHGTAGENLYFRASGADILKIDATGMTLLGTAGSGSDTALVFDGEAQDYYIGLDDSDDFLKIGAGSTVGTTPFLRIGASGTYTYGMVIGGTSVASADSDYATGVAFMPNITSHSGDDNFVSLVSMGGTLAGQSLTTGGNTGLATTLHLSEPDISGGHTITDVATLYIQNAPTEGTNDYALFVDSGNTRLDGNLIFAEDATDHSAKYSVISQWSYETDEEPWIMMSGWSQGSSTDGSANTLVLGGNDNGYNNATDIRFHTSGVNTVGASGFERMRISSTGDVGINMVLSGTDYAKSALHAAEVTSLEGELSLGYQNSNEKAKIDVVSTADVSTSATTIYTATRFAGIRVGIMLLVAGLKDGSSSIAFTDLIVVAPGGSETTVNVVSTSNSSSADARTYSMAGDAIKVAMAANTYDINVMGFRMGSTD